MERRPASDYPQEVFELYDAYAHNRINRREFIDRVGKYAVAGMTAAALIESLSPNYALAEQIPKDDPRIQTSYAEYDSPTGSGKMKGYLALPAELAKANEGGGEKKKLPAVLVIHENRGLNPYIEDVARRVGAAGFIGFAPDALTPLGGYPGNDDEGRAMQAKLDGKKITEDFIAAVDWLLARPDCNGKIGAVGFCFGGGMVNTLVVRIPEKIQAGVPFYGRAPAAEDVPKIKAAMLVQNAEKDERIVAGWPAYEAALKAAGVDAQGYVYPGANHGFHNDTTPRYDEAAATLAWTRTIDFFNEKLKGEKKDEKKKE